MVSFYYEFTLFVNEYNGTIIHIMHKRRQKIFKELTINQFKFIILKTAELIYKAEFYGQTDCFIESYHTYNLQHNNSKDEL